MKNNLILTCFFVSVFFSLLYSCKEEKNIYYLDSKANTPAHVADIHVFPTPGGALITYEIPNDNNLSYVKAVYEIQPGVFREAKSSYYINKLSLEGFGDTLTHSVRIYSVGRNEKHSDPLLIDVKPLIPPVKSVYNTLNVKPTFGGLNVTFSNDSQSDLAVVVIVDTKIGDNSKWSDVTTFYTDALVGNYSARGFEPVEQNFGVYLKDRWSNKSDTLFISLTPLYEEVLDKSYMRALTLPTDAQALSPYLLPYLIDGISGVASNIYATLHETPLPQWFTLDLNADGKQVVLSRFKMFHRPAQYAYNQAVPLKFEIWGANNPDPQGGWDGWSHLGTFESYKPSGLPLGQTNAEDIAYAVTGGEDFEFDITPAPCRYFRFKTIDTYGGGGQIVIAELTFWGQVIN